MDLVAILSTVILLVTIGTITIAIAAYVALKLRDRRKPKAGKLKLEGVVETFEPVFLKRYMPPASGTVKSTDQPDPAE